jgi:hypothetical protein
MPYTGQDAASDLGTARDAAATYLGDNLNNMDPQAQNSLNGTITQIDLRRQVIAMQGVLDALDPTGELFKNITNSTTQASARLDSLARTEKTVAKAIGIATAVLGLATAIEGGNVVAIGAAIVGVTTASK